MRIAVYVVDDVFDTGLSSILDTFDAANDLGGTRRFDVRLVSPRGRVRTHQGFTVPAEPVGGRADLAIVPALACKSPTSIVAARERSDVGALVQAVRAHAAKGRIAAACTGTFVLGWAGVLDGRRATTTWWLGPTFRQQFPAVELDASSMIVSDAAVTTAGAALAHVDLALSIVRERSPDLAATVARHLLLDERPSQAPFVAPSHVAHDDELVKRFERWARERLGEKFALARAARAIGASERTLQRRVRAVLGKTPVSFVQDLRLERAVHLLRTSKASVQEVATAVGYGDGASLGALLRRRLRTGVRAIR